MKINNNFFLSLVLVVALAIGYMLGSYTTDSLFAKDKLLIGVHNGWGYYKILTTKQPYTLLERIENLFIGDDNLRDSEIQGLLYCGFVADKETQLPINMGWGYVKLNDAIWYAGEKITSCTGSSCILNEQNPRILYDGTQTFYEGVLLSGFDYNNFTILDLAYSVFTDKKTVYFQGRELVGMDWETFEHPRQTIQEFQDKNYIYTRASSPLSGSYIERTKRTSGL